MQRRGAAFHRALPDFFATIRMNGSQRTDRASTAESVRLLLLSLSLCSRARDPHGGGSRALTWNWPGRVFSLEWMLIYGRWETAVRLMGARFYCFSFASHHFSLSAHQHLAHELFYVLSIFFLNCCRVCVVVRSRVFEYYWDEEYRWIT